MTTTSGDDQEQRSTAAQRIWQLFQDWEHSRTWPKKTVQRVRRTINRWRNQIVDGKGKIGNLEKLFTERVDPIIAETLTKQRVSLQATMDALQELIDLHRTWQQAKHPLPEHTAMLRHVRKLIHEIEHGYIDNVSERFNHVSQKD